MVLLVLLLEAPQDRDGVFDSRFVDDDRLETACQGRVLLDVLAVFVERRRADAVELTASEGGLEKVGGVHRAVRLARADQRVHLVDEQDDAAVCVVDFRQHGLEPFLELSAVLRSRDQGAHVQREQALALEAFGNVAVDDAQREAFCDGGLANAGFADENGIVLRAARQHLHGTSDFLVAPDDRVEFAVACHGRQVTGVPVERVEAFLGGFVVRGLAFATGSHGFGKGVGIETSVGKHALGFAGFGCQGEEEAVDRHEFVVGLVREAVGFHDDGIEPPARLVSAMAFDPRVFLDKFPCCLGEGEEVALRLVDEGACEPVDLVAGERHGQVDLGDDLVVVHVGRVAGGLDHFEGFGCEAACVHDVLDACVGCALST